MLKNTSQMMMGDLRKIEQEKMHPRLKWRKQEKISQTKSKREWTLSSDTRPGFS